MVSYYLWFGVCEEKKKKKKKTTQKPKKLDFGFVAQFVANI